VIQYLKTLFYWIKWKIAQRRAISQAIKNDKYIYPID